MYLSTGVIMALQTSRETVTYVSIDATDVDNNDRIVVKLSDGKLLYFKSEANRVGQFVLDFALSASDDLDNEITQLYKRALTQNILTLDQIKSIASIYFEVGDPRHGIALSDPLRVWVTTVMDSGVSGYELFGDLTVRGVTVRRM